MFGFSNWDHRSAIAVDVGSSSVGVAIVCIFPDNTTETIWEHREYCLIHNDATATIQIKQIKTALTNAFLELSHFGLKALKEAGRNTHIDEVQSVISAPWSYTITKTITLKDEHPFPVTKELVNELVESAKKQSKLVFATNSLASTLGLELTHGDVVSIAINEYPIHNPFDQEGRSVSLSYLETAISKDVAGTLSDTIEKFFPKAKQATYSFMYAFYLTMRNLRPNTSEICLVDVTGEATEIGIIREDILRYTTFTPSGMYSIARSIATVCDIPKEEAYSYMKESPEEMANRVPKRATEKMTEVLEDYNEQLTSMFQRTGDSLSIPKTIFLHTDARTEAFFINQLEAAALKATGKPHTIHPVTAKVLGIQAKEDTALLLSINFLAHKDHYMKILPEDS